MPTSSSSITAPFDPLSLENVGVTLAVETLEQPLQPLPPPRFPGAGVYVIYYGGTHPAYEPLRALEAENGSWKYPVYVGSALRENAKQGFQPQSTTERRIYDRILVHARSIRQASLDLADFRCRYLVLNDAHVTLAESVLITTLRPAWNGMGLGSNGVGGPRMAGEGSLWDSLHPGRRGRPAGSEDRSKDAAEQISKSIRMLAEPPADPRTARMVAKIQRFLRDTA